MLQLENTVVVIPGALQLQGEVALQFPEERPANRPAAVVLQDPADGPYRLRQVGQLTIGVRC